MASSTPAAGPGSFHPLSEPLFERVGRSELARLARLQRFKKFSPVVTSSCAGQTVGETLDAEIPALRWGMAEMQGYRGSMEDAHIVSTAVAVPGCAVTISFFAVFVSWGLILIKTMPPPAHPSTPLGGRTRSLRNCAPSILRHLVPQQ